MIRNTPKKLLEVCGVRESEGVGGGEGGVSSCRTTGGATGI